MKTLTTIVAALFLVAATGAYAAAPKPPDKVTLKAEKSKEGAVSFDHKAHMKIKDSCKQCHGAGKPEKITIGEEKAHRGLPRVPRQDGEGPRRREEVRRLPQEVALRQQR